MPGAYQVRSSKSPSNIGKDKDILNPPSDSQESQNLPQSALSCGVPRNAKSTLVMSWKPSSSVGSRNRDENPVNAMPGN